MTTLRHTIPVFLVVLVSMTVASSAAADPAPAADATFLLGHDIFASGQSDNLGPAISQRIDDYWTAGGCPDSNPAVTSYDDCDEVRFGLSMYADPTCTDANAHVPLVGAQEDGGGLVDTRISGIHNEGGTTWCNSMQYIPHDSGLYEFWNFTFNGWNTATDADLDRYWERPRLRMSVIGELPQTGPGDPDDRVLNSLQHACTALEGGPNGDLPAMPTWVMMARTFDHESAPYAGLLSAAGGTGTCCYGTDNDNDGFADCNPVDDAIDVCAHVNDGRNEAKIRADMKNGKYNCGGTGTTAGTGLLDFGDNKKGTLAQIKCHLVGESYGTNCASDDRQDTDILGIFSCIRQLPRGLSWQDARIRYCPDSGDEDDCEILTEDNGGIEFIDPQKTMFMINNSEGTCDALIGGGGDIQIDPCPNEGKYCTVAGEVGRCAFGKYVCRVGGEVCESIFRPMPEICNGLDDDCNGSPDDMRDSWTNQPAPGNYSLPSDHQGLACSQTNTCVCPDGNTDDHADENFTTTVDEEFQYYLDGWDPICECAEGLSPSGPTSTGEPAPMRDDPQAACSSTDATKHVPIAASILLLIGLGFIRRRRRDD